MKPQDLKRLFLRYRSAGFRPFPVLCYRYFDPKNGWRREKRPQGPWKDFETRQPSLQEIDKWCAHPYANYYGIGVSTDGLVVLDFDHKDGNPNMLQFAEDIPLESTMWTRTASGGVHMLFLNTGDEIRNKTDIFGKADEKSTGATVVDVRADGGYVVVGDTELWSEDPIACKVKSTLKVEATYRTENLTRVDELPELPQAIRDVIPGAGEVKGEAKYRNIRTAGLVGEGTRNETATSLAFRLMMTVKNSKDYEVNYQTYWNIIEEKWEGWENDKNEYEKAWQSALDKMRQKKGKNFPDESNVVIAETRNKVREDIQFAEDLNEWGLNIKQVLRIGEIFKFTTYDDLSFELNAEDFYSQTRFRTAFTYGTNKVLPAIKAKSFEKFLEQLRPIDLLDSGTSLKDIVRDVLISQAEKIASSSTFEEAIAFVSAASWAVYGKRIYFHPHSILQSHSYLAKKANISKIVSVLHDIGAKQEKIGLIGYWYYDIS